MKNQSCQFWSNHKHTVCQFGKQTLLRPFPHITRCRSWTHFVFAAHCTPCTPIVVCEPLVCFVPPSCRPHFLLSTHAASCSCCAALPASTISDPPPSCPVACWWRVALRSVHFPTACKTSIHVAFPHSTSPFVLSGITSSFRLLLVHPWLNACHLMRSLPRFS
jgi:hypothetical protein